MSTQEKQSKQQKSENGETVDETDKTRLATAWQSVMASARDFLKVETSPAIFGQEPLRSTPEQWPEVMGASLARLTNRVSNEFNHSLTHSETLQPCFSGASTSLIKQGGIVIPRAHLLTVLQKVDDSGHTVKSLFVLTEAKYTKRAWRANDSALIKPNARPAEDVHTLLIENNQIIRSHWESWRRHVGGQIRSGTVGSEPSLLTRLIRATPEIVPKFGIDEYPNSTVSFKLQYHPIALARTHSDAGYGLECRAFLTSRPPDTFESSETAETVEQGTVWVHVITGTQKDESERTIKSLEVLAGPEGWERPSSDCTLPPVGATS